MRLTKKPVLIVAAGLLGVCLASTVRAADEYKIKLDHPFNVGDKFVITEKLKVKLTQKSDTAKDMDFTAELAGTETVEAVADNSKQPTKFTFKVSKCLKDGKEIVPAGSIVLAENVDGHTHVTIDGNEIDKDLKPVLDDLFDTTDPDDSTGDEQLGTDVAQKVGGTWKLNPEVVAKQLQKEQLPVEPDDLKGGGKLDGITTVEGKDAEKITLKIDAVYDKKTLGEVEITNFNLHFESSNVIPVDESSQTTTSVSKSLLTMKVDSPQGKADVKLERSRESTCTPAT